MHMLTILGVIFVIFSLTHEGKPLLYPGLRKIKGQLPAKIDEGIEKAGKKMTDLENRFGRNWNDVLQGTLHSIEPDDFEPGQMTSSEDDFSEEIDDFKKQLG
ncbi:uncharacterized protein LOC143446171 [Clavelina lepadiformis]|uniref:uncharacterized protein LOC143446171 n=1 Tax=Clavelina lepadiformis TaxID=159417 RepID=UPI004041BDC9